MFFYFFFFFFQAEDGIRDLYVTGVQTCALPIFLSLSGGFDWTHNVVDAQWIENTADGRHIFGHLDQTTVSLTSRLNYTITPQLTIQIYAQPFVSAGDYTRFKQLVNGRAPRYEDRFAPAGYTVNPDFNYR